jgi:putative phosphoesterase
MTITTTLGIIADTHIPDRTRRLNPQVIPFFRESRVELILHAGDISSASVLKALEQVAPVYAVRGNRDWFFLNHLPHSLKITIQDIPIWLTHGHGSLYQYLSGHVYKRFKGEITQRMQEQLIKSFPDARVIVFGHLHQPLIKQVGNQLLFNPGTPHFPSSSNFTPTVGLLHITGGGEVFGEIKELEP